MLQAQADALLLAIDIEHHNVNILANLEQFGGVPDAAPTHVGDVKQAIDAVQIDKRAEIRDVLDGALPDVTRGHLAEELLAALHSFLFDQFAPGEHDVLPLLVDFDDLEIVGVADVLRQVLRRYDVNLGSGQKGFNADIDEQPALDHALDFTGDGAPFIANGQDAFPILLELRLFLGKNDHSLLVFELLNQHIYLVAQFDPFEVFEFVGGNDPLALVTDIHKEFLGTNLDDSAFDDIASRKGQRARLLHGFFHCQHR